jgi:hypothetical protein
MHYDFKEGVTVGISAVRHRVVASVRVAQLTGASRCSFFCQAHGAGGVIDE